MKTAMQELFERLEEYKKKYDKDSIEYEIFGMASGMAWCRLEKEKEQIINAWIATDNKLQRLAAEEY